MTVLYQKILNCYDKKVLKSGNKKRSDLESKLGSPRSQD